MRWSEVTARPENRKLREFAAAGATVGSALAAWQAVSSNAGLAAGLLLAALAFAVVGFWKPRWLAPVFWIAMAVTFPLAWAVSLLVLALLFYGLFGPLGLLFRLLGRDPLERRIDPDQRSYWKATQPADDSRRYLRQY